MAQGAFGPRFPGAAAGGPQPLRTPQPSAFAPVAPQQPVPRQHVATANGHGAAAQTPRALGQPRGYSPAAGVRPAASVPTGFQTGAASYPPPAAAQGYQQVTPGFTTATQAPGYPTSSQGYSNTNQAYPPPVQNYNDTQHAPQHSYTSVSQAVPPDLQPAPPPGSSALSTTVPSQSTANPQGYPGATSQPHSTASHPSYPAPPNSQTGYLANAADAGVVGQPPQVGNTAFHHPGTSAAAGYPYPEASQGYPGSVMASVHQSVQQQQQPGSYGPNGPTHQQQLSGELAQSYPLQMTSQQQAGVDIGINRTPQVSLARGWGSY